ncbi:uncharacterized 38.1 kDa protein isoform X1 [Nymphaea colorata]|uniref:uncharacterized 38.1 kDa protein isoform X1 n=1 Tax=Nymphaea colorata TaxID=210225 RepID=UPI00129DB7FE|nr:uncharacterized 38.1 kDa protein isoform X1 [Nymphaea colorata]
MGNVLRLLGKCCNPSPQEEGQSLGPHGVTYPTPGVAVLAHDLFHFDNTGEVPDGLSRHVVSSKKAQANWYKKLVGAWKEAKPPPKSPEAASKLIIETLRRHRKEDVEGVLAFYGLPATDAITGVGQGLPLSLPGVKLQFTTLPVDTKDVADGDTITVYVDTKEARESAQVPDSVRNAVTRRSKELAKKNYAEANALQKQIFKAGYRVSNGPNGDILARKYRIRLRGIDAPESSMPYGAEAKEALRNLVGGNSLEIHVYEEDQYGRSVADVYCNGIFVQEFMLKKGLAWHYVAYDRRPQFAKWEKEAQVTRIGLWASSDPEKPWEWRKDNRRGV